MDNENFKKNYSMQTVHRAVKILRAFSREHTRLTLTELNGITGIGKSSLQRLLSTLTMEGLLQRNEQDKRYQLGLEFIFLAELVERNSSLLSLAQPVMKRLSKETNESISLSVIENNMRKCIHHIESKHELTTLTYVGQTSPLYAGASAKILLAYFSDEELDNYLNNTVLESITNNTTTSKEELLRQLESIRKMGYANSNGERVKGAVSISTPIFDPFSNILSALTVMIPSVRMDENDLDDLIKKMKDGATEITEKLLLYK